MLFTDTPRSRRNRAHSRLASACGQTVETLESRRLLTVTGLDITAITSPTDTDGGAGGAEHVTVVPGSTVTAYFAYSSTVGIETTAKFNIGTIATTTPQGTTVPSGANQAASLSLVIPLGTAAGTYAAHVQVKNGSGSGTTDNDSDAAAVDVVITVAPLATTLSITAADATYNGSAYSQSHITPTFGPSGALGAITYEFFSDAAGNSEIAAPIDAGTYYVRGHFASSDLTKWLNADSNIASFDVDPLATTLSINTADVTYSGPAYAESNITANLAPSDALGTITYTFFSDAAGTNEIAAPTNAGTYYVQAHFAAGTNWLDADSSITGFEIGKTNATVTTVNYADVYDGQSHTASVTITGLGGIVLASNSVDRTNAGSDSVTASISGNQNYNDASGTATIDIARADATIVVEGYSGIYDGQAHGASGTAAGVLGESLTGLDLGDSFTDFPGGTAHWAFTDVTGNYNDAAGDAEITIAKADATVTIVDYGHAYDGYAHTASVTITGVGGTILATGSVSRTNAGNDSVTASISGNQNYNDASGTATIDIAKADATIVVNGYTGAYDGNAHGASGKVTGVLGEDLAGLVLGDSFTNFPGGTAHWAFTDVTGNYNDAAGDVEIAIAKATLTGIARTQDALNIAKQGTLTIDISSIAGLQGADTIIGVFSSAVFKLSICGNDYEFQPSVSIDALTNTVRVSYALKGGTAAADSLKANLMALDCADGVASTSASKTPYSTMWVVAESANYTFSDDFLTRLFCSAK